MAVKERLCIACWPVALKDSFFGKGLSLSTIAGDKEREWGKGKEKEKDKAGPLEEMWDQMQRVYEGTNDDQCLTVESWTQDEMELDDPSNVLIVTCIDGTVLLCASESRLLVSMLQKKIDAAAKQVRGKSVMVKRKVSRGDDGDMDSESEGESRPKSKTSRNLVAGPSNAPPAPRREVAPKLSKFRFHNPENGFWSDTFTASGIQ
ncbi:hypothetical protein K438DRAFT_1986392 [Mycena galopus ATCC 62051]|nr:hypothetical protein K438DRAFT_1986392 [Mycena galopus ATCC 62051]